MTIHTSLRTTGYAAGAAALTISLLAGCGSNAEGRETEQKESTGKVADDAAAYAGVPWQEQPRDGTWYEEQTGNEKWYLDVRDGWHQRLIDAHDNAAAEPKTGEGQCD
jgi:hypothetical protein